jgi:hypothetical protein
MGLISKLGTAHLYGIPMFNYICLCLSEADIDSTLYSYLIPYFVVFAVVFSIFVLIYSVIWFTFFVYTLFWLNPSDWFIFCHVIVCLLSVKAHVIFPTPASHSRHGLSRYDALKTKQKCLLIYVFVWVHVNMCTVTVIELIVFSYN